MKRLSLLAVMFTLVFALDIIGSENWSNQVPEGYEWVFDIKIRKWVLQPSTDLKEAVTLLQKIKNKDTKDVVYLPDIEKLGILIISHPNGLNALREFDIKSVNYQKSDCSIKIKWWAPYKSGKQMNSFWWMYSYDRANRKWADFWI